ncbi:MAG: hypothetical protein P4L46_05450 [Fimbriimonas sp.]|nr:hypothetical protein [Fimbriimonas sp.]
MTPKSMLCASLLLGAVSFACAVQDEGPSKLPIDTPKGATISFEAEGAGKDFIPILKRLLSDDPTDFRSHSNPKVSVKTPLGDLDLSIDDLAPLIEQVHDLHVVIYSGGASEDPFGSQERRLSDAGLKRLTLVPGDNGPLIMRKEGKAEEYGIVLKSKGTITVLRTEGGPNLGDIGKVAYETLARLVQQTAKVKKHG